MIRNNSKEKAVYIVLSHTGTRFSKVIKHMTKIPYSHVSIALDEDLNELYSFGRKRPKNPFYCGFVREDIINGTFAYFPNTRCLIYKLEVDDHTYDDIKHNINIFKSKRILTYNFPGVVGLSVNKSISIPRSYFCSEFVATILEDSNVTLFEKHPSSVAPKDFLECELYEFYYSGLLGVYYHDRKIRSYAV